MSVTTKPQTDGIGFDPTEAPNIEYLGTCYDVLRMDPNKLSVEGPAVRKQVLIPFSDQGKGDDPAYKQAGVGSKNYLIPPNTVITEVPASEGDKSLSFNDNASSYFNSSTDTVSVNFGIPGIFGYSQDETFTNSDGGESEVFKMSASQNAFATYYKASLDNFANVEPLPAGSDPVNPAPSFKNSSTIEPEAGAPVNWINSELVNDINNLPNTWTEPNNFPYMPYPVSEPYMAYLAFLKKWGTHFTSNLMTGGIAKFFQTFDYQQFGHFSAEGYSIEAGVSGLCEDFYAGVKGGTSNEAAEAFKNIMGVSSSSYSFIGGDGIAGSTSWADWAKTIHDNPAPIKAGMNFIFELFPYVIADKTVLQSKYAAMQNIIKQYFYFCGYPYIDLSGVCPVYGYTDVAMRNEGSANPNYYKAVSPNSAPPTALVPGGEHADTYNLQGVAFSAFNTSIVDYYAADIDSVQFLSQTQSLTAVNIYSYQPFMVGVFAQFYYLTEEQYKAKSDDNLVLQQENAFYVLPEDHQLPIVTTKVYQFQDSKGRIYYGTGPISPGDEQSYAFLAPSGAGSIIGSIVACDVFLDQGQS